MGPTYDVVVDRVLPPFSLDGKFVEGKLVKMFHSTAKPSCHYLDPMPLILPYVS